MTKAQQAALAAMPQTGYAFNEKVHLHVLDGKPLTGITTILGVIAKPALIQWSADEAVKHLGWVNDKYCSKEEKEQAMYEIGYKLKQLWTPETFYTALCEARIQHTKRKKDAGTIGTNVHKKIEIWILEAISNGGYIKGDMPHVEDPQEKSMLTHFWDWALRNTVKFLESERHLHSREMWIGGICDFVCEIEGKVWIGDIKTASGIYPENFAQMAGYELMLKEMGLYEEIAGHIVLNLRKDGTFEEKRSVSNEDNRKFFLACLEIYRLKEKIDNQII